MNILVGFFMVVLGAVPYTTWQKEYDGGNTDKGHGACLDSLGNVVIIGESNPETDFDAWIINVDNGTGDSIWSLYYDDGADERGVDITTAKEGGLAVAVNTEGAIKTVLYNPQGEFLWERMHSRLGIQATAINASSNGDIYTVGKFSTSTVNHFLTIDGYDYSGQQFINVEEGAAKNTIGQLEINQSGSIYLGGDQESPCMLWKFTPTGEFEWWEEYDGLSAKGFALELNSANHLFHAGVFTNGSDNSNFLLLKWDTAGTIIWPDSIKTFDLGHNEYCRDIKLDEISDCYLAGWQVRGEEEDACVVKTDSAGRMLWSWVYEQEGDQEIEAIEVDSEGYIYLAGSHHNGANWDMLVMQIRQPLTISGRITDTVGASMSGVPVKLSGDTTVEVVSDTDGFYSIEVYNGGNYVVSPDLPGWVFTPSSHTYTPLAHRELDQNFSGEYTAIEEPATPVTPVTHLSIGFQPITSTLYITYSLPAGQPASLSLYDASGQLIERLEVAGSGSVEIPPQIPSGLYVVRLVTNDTEISKKVMVR